MRKFLNDPADFADEALEGVLLAHPDRLRRVVGSPRAIVGVDALESPRVVVATGGGSGHLPLFLGYVAQGLADGCAVGNMFASPGADVVLAVTEAIDRGQGVLYLYGNYGGDRINFDMAAELAEEAGITVVSVLGADDVLSAESPDRRRGIAGIFFGYAVAASAARSGATLEKVAEVTARALDRTVSAGVALSGPVLPTVGTPNFELAEDEIEIGTGIHGEPGRRRIKLYGIDAIVDELMETLLNELPEQVEHGVAVLVNGLGSTPPEELYIIYRRAHQLLSGAGIAVRHALVGEYATSLEMAGASISLLALDEDIDRHLATSIHARLVK
ncbi:MAG: dihydroxyacetone kinase [Ilumatobacteraceae bacterium]|nr:dihydroxyacetone kinase [Ilumatobacteraceae bacterium]